MLKLTVPLEAQQKNSTCWHASALMIWRYWQGKTGRAGPMHTLINKWQANNTISPPEFIKLAKNVGLITVPASNNKNHTAASLEAYLKKHGPVWCAGFWYGPGHIVVLTGVDQTHVYLNDPDGGKTKKGSILWFNTKLASQYVGCMMVKNPAAY